MKVQIINDENQVIWERGQDRGLACRSYVTDGMQEKIINTLKNAMKLRAASCAVSVVS